MTYVGSNSRLNAVVGVTEIIPLTIGLEAEYSNKIFKSNLILKKESTGLLYITDGVTKLSALPSVTDEIATYLNQHITDNTIHITPELTEQLNSAVVSVNRLSREVDDISTTINSHINNADLHLSAATIASTYATKAELELAAASGIDTSLFATSEQLNQHIDDESIHVSVSTIADTHATKEEVSALDNIYVTKDELSSVETSISDHIHVSVSTIADTYATKEEVSALDNIYVTKDELSSVETSISDHTTNDEMHLTSSDRKLLQSIGNNTQLQIYELDEIIVSLYS